MLKNIAGYNYCAITASAWKDKDELVEEVFDPKDFKKPIEILYFDLPEFLLNTKIGMEFFEALSDSDDLSLFE